MAFSAKSLPISDCGRLIVTIGCRVLVLGADPAPVEPPIEPAPVRLLPVPTPVPAPVLLADVLLGLNSLRCCP